MSTCLCSFLSVCFSVCLFVFLSVCLTVCLSDCLSVGLSLCMSTSLTVCLSICQSVCMSVFLSVRVSLHSQHWPLIVEELSSIEHKPLQLSRRESFFPFLSLASSFKNLPWLFYLFCPYPREEFTLQQLLWNLNIFFPLWILENCTKTYDNCHTDLNTIEGWTKGKTVWMMEWINRFSKHRGCNRMKKLFDGFIRTYSFK